MRDKVTRQCPQTKTFEEKGESKRIRTEVPQLTSLTLYRSAKPAHSCEADKGTLEHMFWNCAKTQVFWLDFVDWLCIKFSRCNQLRLSKELVIFGYNNSNVHTDTILDLFILLAKYHIFHAKTTSDKPLIQVFVRTVKQRFVVEKYSAVI